MRRKGSLSLTVEEVEQAKALSALGRSYRAIGRELHRSAHTIKRALTSSGEVVAEVQTMKRNLADSFQGLAERMIDSITDEEIKELDAYKRTLSGAIAVDKSQVLRGQPSTIVGIEVLLDIAGAIRRQERQADEEAHTLPAPSVVQRVLPAPTAEPIPAPVPAQSKTELHPPTPSVRVKYYTPTPVEDSQDESPLTHGLFSGKT
jgi:hypothetical protein